MINDTEGPKTEILSIDYSDGKRITQQLVTYNKSDDVLTLGKLQIQLADVLRRLEKADITKESTDDWGTARDSLTAKIETQQGYIDGYDKAVKTKDEK